LSLFIVDVESDGPAPGISSMISIGAIRLDDDLSSAPTFKGLLRPICDRYDPGALAVSGFSREQTMTFPEAHQTMAAFGSWVAQNTAPWRRPIFVSDNPSFDFAFVNYYFRAFGECTAGAANDDPSGRYGDNPFGFSARRIGDFFAGLQKDYLKASSWKSLRKTAHTHDPLDDARGNTEALLEMARRSGVRLPLGLSGALMVPSDQSSASSESARPSTGGQTSRTRRRDLRS
jgi:DNA polymerase III epsilon subunit-like protein